MKDKTTWNEHPDVSGELKRYIEAVAKGILLKGEKLEDSEGMLKMYLENENVDYEPWKHAMEMFLETMRAYANNPSQALFDVARFPARKCFVSPKCMGYLAHQLKGKQPPKKPNMETKRDTSWKRTGLGFQDGYFYYTITNATNNWVQVQGYSSAYPSTLEIPKTVQYREEEFTVVSVKEHAFYGGVFSEIKLPDSILEIGESAFAECRFLKKVIIPDSVTKIGNRAFYYCTALCSVSLPKHLAYIPKECFSGTQLSQITLSNSIVEIQECAFAGTHLQTIVIPDSVRAIGNRVFCYNKELKKAVLSKHLTDIPNGLFRDSPVEEVYIPDGILDIGDEAFINCSLKSISLPQSLESIGNGAFANNDQLEFLSIPSSVRYIGQGAFWGCKKIQEVYLSNNVSFFRESSDQTPSFDKATKIYFK